MIIGLLLFFMISTDAPIIRGEVIRHIEYKKGQILDIYLPTQPVYDKMPVIVYVHGGAWIGGRKIFPNQLVKCDLFAKLDHSGRC